MLRLMREDADMQKPRLKHSLRRFTTIGSTIDLLRNKRVAFLDPEKWDDRNDAEFMRLFKGETDCDSLKALCCTESQETYHHWRVFTHSTDGCFIDFKKAPLLASIKGNDDYRASAMEYIRLDEIKISDYRIRDLPFLKRAGFQPENEFRIIYTGACDDDVHFMPVNLAWINRIVLNPWLPPSIADSIADTFRDIGKGPDLTVTSSRLTNSRVWTRWGSRIVRRGVW